MSSKPTLRYFPQFLSEEEVSKPLKVVEDFFLSHSITQSREFLRSGLKPIGHDYLNQNLQREDLASFFSKLDKLIEGMVVISLQNWKEQNAATEPASGVLEAEETSWEVEEQA